MGMSMDSQFSISAPLISDKCIALLFVPFFHFSRNTRGHSYLSFVFMIGCKSPFLRHKDNVFFSLLSSACKITQLFPLPALPFLFLSSSHSPSHPPLPLPGPHRQPLRTQRTTPNQWSGPDQGQMRARSGPDLEQTQQLGRLDAWVVGYGSWMI